MTRIYCDICGKELDATRTRVSYTIRTVYASCTADFCDKCATDLFGSEVMARVWNKRKEKETNDDRKKGAEDFASWRHDQVPRQLRSAQDDA